MFAFTELKTWDSEPFAGRAESLTNEPLHLMQWKHIRFIVIGTVTAKSRYFICALILFFTRSSPGWNWHYISELYLQLLSFNILLIFVTHWLRWKNRNSKWATEFIFPLVLPKIMFASPLSVKVFMYPICKCSQEYKSNVEMKYIISRKYCGSSL